MKIIWLLFWMPLWVNAQTGFNGVFTSVNNGVVSTMDLTEHENNLDGTYDEGKFHLRIKGSVNGKAVSGELVATTGPVVADFTGTMKGNDTIDVTLRMAGQEQRAAFARKRSAAVSASAGKLQPAAALDAKPRDKNLVGTWSYQNVINSGDASLATALYFSLEADGRYKQFSKGAGGGSDWSYTSGDALVQQGMWYADRGIIYLKPEGTSAHEAGATYQFHEGKLVTKDVNGQKIWERM